MGVGAGLYMYDTIRYDTMDYINVHPKADE